jgi:hypothetical protein
MRKFKHLLVCLVVLVISPSFAKGGSSNMTWESKRLATLKAYRDGDETAAFTSLKASLEQARKMAQSEPYEQILSMCDLARYYEFERQFPEAKQFYEDATKIAEELSHRQDGQLSKRDGEIVNTLVVNYADLLRLTGDKIAAASLVSKFGDQAAKTMGVASMDKDYTITLQISIDDPGVMSDAVDSYKVSSAKYDSILSHLGLMKPGKSRFLAAWAENL